MSETMTTHESLAPLAPTPDHAKVAFGERRQSLKRVNWVKSASFFLMHLSVLFVFVVPFSWNMVALALGLYVLRMFGITAGYHRYFSHKSYRTSRPFQFVLAVLGGLSAQKGALWWAANHRHHHKHSDDEHDIHSPKHDGFIWSHVGWILTDDYNETQWDLIPDLAKYPELVWLNKHHDVLPWMLGIGLFLAGGWSALVWGLVVSTVLLWHGTFTINSLSHVYGSRRYETSDTSRNNFWLALITLGEGWHNNHHCYMSSANQGFYWWEVDMSYYALKLLSWCGLVSNLKKPPMHLLEARRLDRRSPTPTATA
jgi:stearoyl-CoA desaturase (delta-9 desaturase)